jgi:demethylmenaquinone methyltransferase/2-methoxy-6-polyprenyl-1,4-benzoquinol methylase
MTPSGSSGQRRFAQGLFAPLPARYDRLAEWLSFGQNRRWRAEMVKHALSGGPDRVLDVACGTGGVTFLLAERSSAEVLGIDLTEPMVAEGRRRLPQDGRGQQVAFCLGDAQELPFPDASFDALTFTYLLRYVQDPLTTLKELARVVKPGGRVASLEFYVPPSRFWLLWWWLYTRAVLPLGGLVTGGRHWAAVGRFLGPNISKHYRQYPLDWTVGAWRRAGFEEVSTKVMSLGGGLVMWGRRGTPRV